MLGPKFLDPPPTSKRTSSEVLKRSASEQMKRLLHFMPRLRRKETPHQISGVLRHLLKNAL